MDKRIVMPDPYPNRDFNDIALQITDFKMVLGAAIRASALLERLSANVLGFCGSLCCTAFMRSGTDAG